MIVNLQVNDENYALGLPACRSLAEVLSADIGLTETKQSCGEGFCDPYSPSAGNRATAVATTVRNRAFR